MLTALHDRLDALEWRVNEALPGPLKVGFLTLYLHSKRGTGRLDVVATRRLWNRWADIAIGVLLLLQIGGVAVIAVAAWQALGQTHATALNDPMNTIAIPGLNSFMPLAAAPYIVFALIVATVVHEAGHAIACRGEDVRIAEWGLALLFGVLPIAAYVLPDDELDTSSVRSRMRIYAIGVFHNFLVAAATFGLLASPITASPVDAYMVYFGWALVGGTPPTAAAVASLGALTNLCFWLALLNANVGVLNALPVTILDGGRVLSLLLQRFSEATGIPFPSKSRAVLVHATSAVALLLVVVALLGPRLRI